MKLHHPSMHKGPTFDPIRFFEEVVPQALTERAQAAGVFGSTIRFVLTAPARAAKAYVVDMNAAKVTVDETTTVDAEVTVDARRLEALLTGKLDPVAARAEGHLRVVGDESALAQLAVLLRP